MGTLVEMKGVVKKFPGVTALKDISFDIQSGEVHVLLGENGAGKSTLMKILSGVYQPDIGDSRADGRIPRAALCGISHHSGRELCGKDRGAAALQGLIYGKEKHQKHRFEQKSPPRLFCGGQL